MFRWYQESVKCYVYLPDVSTHKRDSDGSSKSTWIAAFRSSRWFTRGWTLQELLAPQNVEFFCREREQLGDKKSLSAIVSEITRIPTQALQGTPLSSFSIKERLAWRNGRGTKRLEDQAYCMLGIFNVHIAPLYGEGKNSDIRFKDELTRSFRIHLDEPEEFSLRATGGKGTRQVEELRKQMLGSLGFSQIDARRSTIKRAYSTTCGWFLKHSAYLAWTDPSKFLDHRGFIWINGKSGAGKPTLMKFIHASADKTRTEDEVVVSYFFNARGEDLEKSVTGMYRSLLLQLLMGCPDLALALDPFQTSFLEHAQSFQWTTEILQSYISTATAKLGKRRLKCFVDALDECNEQEIREMIVFWEDLGEDALNHGAKVYTCFSSRHYPTIDIRNGRQMILEHETGHGEDLAKYVRSHLRAGKGKVVDEVKDSVCKMADGVFMWAVLVIDVLNNEFSGGRIFAVKKRLQEIPRDLSELFENILRRDNTNMDDLLLCLQWVLFAKRPLNREEFYFAMVSCIDPTSENLDKWDPEHTTQDHMERLLLNSSKGLAELTKSKSATVQFIHESVRDFLLKDDGLSKLWPDLGDDLRHLSHERLKQCCLAYLRAKSNRALPEMDSLPKAKSEEAKALRNSVGTQFPFLKYASGHVFYHANEAAEKLSQDSFVSNFNGIELGALIGVWNVFVPHDTRRYTPNVSLPYIFADNGFAHLIRVAYSLYRQMYTRGERYKYPIYAALATGDDEIIRALLLPEIECSSEVIASLVKLWRDSPPPPQGGLLTHALKHWQQDVCELLAASKAVELQCEDLDEFYALSLAARRGFERMLRLLVERYSLGPKSFWEFRTILGQVSATGKVNIVRYLLALGAKIESVECLPDRERGPLHFAASEGHEAVVRVLLKHTGVCNIHQKDINERTALHLAAENGHHSIVQILIENGADPNASDRYGKTFLHMASRRGSLSVCRTLLEHPTSSNPATQHFNDYSFCAATNGRTAMILFWLMRGADIEAQDSLGLTPLLRACRVKEGETKSISQQDFDILLQLFRDNGKPPWRSRNDIPSAVQFLLEQGANVNHREVDERDSIARFPSGASSYPYYVERCRGRSALMIAAKAGNSSAVSLLIERGAEIDALDVDGRTALSYASGGGHDRVVQLLLELGADPTVADNDGSTALNWCWKTHALALQEEARLRIIRLLLAAGACVDLQHEMDLANRFGYGEALQLWREHRNSHETGENRCRSSASRARVAEID